LVREQAFFIGDDMLRGHQWEDVVEALAALKRRKPELEDLVAFSEQLLLAQHKAPARIDTSALDDGLLRDRVRRGSCFFRGVLVPLLGVVTIRGDRPDWPTSSVRLCQIAGSIVEEV
jgi:hypothetical protein